MSANPKICFLKRRLGNSIARPFSFVLSILGLIILLSGFSFYTIIGVLLLMGGITMAFAKEMTQIDVPNNTLRLYTQILFLKFGNSEPLPDIDYIVIRNFKSRANYQTKSSSFYYYEVALVSADKNKTVLGIIPK